MRWLGLLIRTLIGAVLGFFAVPWCIDLLLATVRQHQAWPPQPVALTAGLVVGGLWWLWRRPNALLHTLIHEMCHALLCLLLFVRITRFEVTAAKGGMVEHRESDPFRTTLISIAPYTVPLLLGPVLAARYFVTTGPWAEVLTALAGFLYCTHLQGLVVNIRQNFWPSEADLSRVGHLLSLVLILCALLLTTTATIIVLWR